MDKRIRIELIQLSVIMPALDAAYRIAPALAAVHQPPMVVEMLVVDGGSQDDPASIAHHDVCSGQRCGQGHD